MQGNLFLPSSLWSIGAQAFLGCSGVTSITIPQVSSIGNSAFAECGSLRTLYFAGRAPGGVTDEAFRGCTAEIVYVIGAEYWTNPFHGLKARGIGGPVTPELMYAQNVGGSIRLVWNRPPARYSDVTSYLISYTVQKDQSYHYLYIYSWRSHDSSSLEAVFPVSSRGTITVRIAAVNVAGMGESSNSRSVSL